MVVLKRVYKMSDGSLAGTAQKLAVAATRDVASLMQYGWTQVRIDALKAARTAFADLPTDVELSGLMMEATAAKNAIRKEATTYCQVEIILRVSQHYGDESPVLKRFNAGELHTASDNDFWFALKRIKRQATALLPNLVDEGLEQSHLDTLADYITDMDDAMEAQKVAIDDRDRAVYARIEAGNALYAEMVKLAEVGKRIWLGVNDSLYNDYILYPNQTGAAAQEDKQIFESDVAPSTVLNLSLSAIDGSETFEVANTGAVVLYIYFSALPTDYPGPQVPQLLPGQTETGTAEQAGYQPGVREYLNVYNPNGEMPGHINVTVTG